LKWLYKYVKKFHGEESDGLVSLGDGIIPGSSIIIIKGVDHHTKSEKNKKYNDSVTIFMCILATALEITFNRNTIENKNELRGNIEEKVNMLIKMKELIGQKVNNQDMIQQLFNPQNNQYNEIQNNSNQLSNNPFISMPENPYYLQNSQLQQSNPFLDFPSNVNTNNLQNTEPPTNTLKNSFGGYPSLE